MHPSSENNCYQNYDVNLTSRSDIIFDGSPNRQTQCSKNKLAASKAVKEELQGMNLQTRENLSTIENIESKPRVDVGSPTTKSMVTCWKGRSGFSTG